MEFGGIHSANLGRGGGGIPLIGLKMTFKIEKRLKQNSLPIWENYAPKF